MDQDDKDHPKEELDERLEKIEKHLVHEGAAEYSDLKKPEDMSIDEEIKYTQDLVKKERDDLEKKEYELKEEHIRLIEKRKQ